ncbi:MAG: hypothetical protein HLUCCX14_05020 [Marinobacter excellens HL-55]|uniref:Uncharacterized protein n=1 Tax=Marinobacter excellens HL-55 TaxID=1305731 RepID=A0A0N8KL01_9GAMM|nr:MAG: hypothetical protein HLUCCX14_05020 [Marinobacter excellens HL-55]
MNKQLIDRLTNLEGMAQREEITITRIVFEASGEEAGFEMIRQPDGTWKHEPYGESDHE